MTEGEASILPVILAGGTGTRLWPLSRAEQPKQLLALDHGRTMLQTTLERVSGSGFARPLLLTSEALAPLVHEQSLDLGVSPEALIVESEPKNTAAAIALAAHQAAAQNPNQLLLVVPSDHAIRDSGAFRRAIAQARVAAENDYLVTFGIAASSPVTGYGYIQFGSPLESAPGTRTVVRFVEKPDLATARRYLSEGDYVWNSGIFLFRASAYLTALRSHAPKVEAAAREALRKSKVEPPFVRPDPTAFATSPSISIDYAVMEHAPNVAVVDVDMGWSDVGSWQAVWELADRTSEESALKGEVLDLGTRGCLLHAEPGMNIVAAGIEGIVAVATRDAVLLLPRDRAQDLSAIVQQVRSWKEELTRRHPALRASETKDVD